MTFCITGNRPEKFPFDYKSGASIEMTAYAACIRKLAFDYLNAGYDHFIFGMARGVDIDFGKEIVRYKTTFDKFKNVKIEAAIPYRGQEARYDNLSRKKFKYRIENSGKITYIADEYSRESYLKRDRYMVDNADFVLAIWNGVREGGTYYTIRYAEEKQKQLRIISLKTMFDIDAK